MLKQKKLSYKQGKKTCSFLKKVVFVGGGGKAVGVGIGVLMVIGFGGIAGGIAGGALGVIIGAVLGGMISFFISLEKFLSFVSFIQLSIFKFLLPKSKQEEIIGDLHEIRQAMIEENRSWLAIQFELCKLKIGIIWKQILGKIVGWIEQKIKISK